MTRLVCSLTLLALLSVRASAEDFANDVDLVDNAARIVETISMPANAHNQVQSILVQLKQQMDNRYKARLDAAKARAEGSKKQDDPK